MKIDLNCPVEAWKVTLPTKEDPNCTVRLFNLSALPVVSVEVTILLSTADGEETARITHRGRSLAGTPGKAFHMTVPAEVQIRPDVYEVTIEKVWFDNSSVWRREKEGLTEFTPNNLHRSSELTTLRAIAGDMASGYPDQQKGLWVCVCGRPNPDEITTCVRCHREKAEVFARYSRDAIGQVVAAREEELAAKGRETLERASTETQVRGKDHVHRKKKKGGLIVAVLCLLMAAVLAYGGFHHLLPRVRYELALREMQAADTLSEREAAEAAFAALPGYRDADEQVERSRHARAMMLLGLDEGDAIPDTVKEADILAAAALLTALRDSSLPATADLRETIPGHLRLCDEARAEIMMQESRLDEAEALYREMGETEHADNLTEIAYQRAVALLNSSRWAEARTALTALKDYKDCAALIKDTWYYEGTLEMDVGDAEAGLAILQTIPGHRDVDERILRYHYERGEALRTAGRAAEAAEAFYLAIGYLDAADQANECFYVPASVAFETLDYERAAQLFNKILDYRDAREKWTQAILKAAEKAIAEVRYADAAALLAQLPADHAEGAALLLDCTYLPAKNAYVRGDYAEAIEGFTAVLGHRDSAEMLKKAQYALAGEYRAKGLTQEAADLYAALGDYEQSAARLRDIRYDRANALVLLGDEESLNEAIAIYTDLADDEDCAEKLSAARFALAGELLDKGEHARAREIYTALGDYEGAADQLKACDYVQAVQLAADGKQAEARVLFEALGDYVDSADRVRRIDYDHAAELAKSDPAAALAAFEALGDFADSADRANQLRYEAAEALMEAEPAEAIAAFEALNGFSDSQDRANALRYEAAEALLMTDREAARAAFAALGDFSDSADRVSALYYEDAEALLRDGKQAEAAAAFEALGDYADSAERANTIRYGIAQAYVDAGDWENARAAFEAMGNSGNVDETINALRYEAAEKLLKEGQRETAAAAFAAIGAYSDSAERANQIRYELAEALVQTDPAAAADAFAAIAGYSDSMDRANALRYEAAEKLLTTDWRAAADAFAAIGDYRDSADRAMQVRYDGAQALADGAKWEEAIEVFASLGDYGDSRERILQIRYTQASVLAVSGQWDEAAAAYEALGDYADSRARISMTRYAQAESLADAGNLLDAADVYAALGDYSDASARKEAMWDAFYGPIHATVTAARAEKNYTHMYLQLRSVDMARLPKKYAELQELYYEACYNEGRRLYNEGRPYEAYTCYAVLPADYRDVASIMQRPCYLILGAWTDLQGNEYIFDGSGTCVLRGESLYFRVDGTDVYTGKDINRLEKTHLLKGVTNRNAWLYDQRSGTEVSSYLTRVTK